MSDVQPHASATGDAVTFKISGLAYLTVLLSLIVVVVMIGVSPAWLSWTVIVPIALAWWIHRLKTVVGPEGITAVNTFSTEQLPWSEVSGLAFPKWGGTRAVRTDGTSVRLPAISFDDTPVLSFASGGIIPDPYAAAREARLAAGD